MKLSDVIKHIQKKMPLYTDKFSNKISVSTLTANNKECTVVTSTAHNLKAGDLIVVQGAKISNPIVSLTQSRGLGKIVTQYPHEVTKNSPLRVGDSTHIQIFNANESEYNGRFLIMDIPDDKTIEFSISSDAPATATGSPEIKEECYANFNGRFNVKEVLSPTSFTYELPNVPSSDIATGDIEIIAGVRISGEFSIEHAIKAYQEHEREELWGFAIFDGADVSKKITTGTDAIAEFNKGSDINLALIQNLSFFVFVPTSSEYCWVDFVDLCQELRVPVLKVLHNARFDSGQYDEDCYLSFIGDMPVDTDTNAFLIYQYRFQSTINIYNEDGIDHEFRPRIREFELYEKNSFSESEFTPEYISKGELPNEH